MKRILLALSLLSAMAIPGEAASLVRSYSYYNVRGTTIEDIEKQISMHGPAIDNSGERHPGATTMEFSTRVRYREYNDRCVVDGAQVTVRAKVVLPRWRDRRRATKGLQLIWDTLAADIKRHEESHLGIAKNYARKLEETLRALPRMRSCKDLSQRVEQETTRVLAQHDAEQDHFDEVESINFESRLERLLNYRMEQIEAGRLRY
jgi:Predicted secreted Zn-dependent protease